MSSLNQMKSSDTKAIVDVDCIKMFMYLIMINKQINFLVKSYHKQLIFYAYTTASTSASQVNSRLLLIYLFYH